jgi:hypothetical protein
MSHSHRNQLKMGFMLSFLLIASMASLSMADEFQRSFDFESDELELSSLVGEVTVLPSPSNQFKVEISVRGKDAATDLLEFSTSKGSVGKLVVEFPLDEHKKYVYPPMGRGSSTTISYAEADGEDSSWLRKVFSFASGTNVKVEGRGRGLEMWADITVMVPEGSKLTLVNGVGEITADECHADLDLDSSSGAINARGIVGDFKADTGSGRVVVENIKGSTNIDTGSGSVEVMNFQGDTLLVDTGSGKVKVSQAICRKLDVDTGSGSVVARNVDTDQARIDTGSGSVVLQLDRMGTGKFDIDTGSGGVELFLPENASAKIVADTGSGGVDVLMTGAMYTKKERDRVELLVGDGEAKVRLDTGSGSIKISH